jgi:hypothetical protein
VQGPPNDRYEPLPGFLSLPGFLYRKLGPGGRLAVKVGGTILVVGLAAAAIVLLPRIAESNRDREAQERRDAAAALAARVRRLRAEQRPQRGRAPAGASRPAVVGELEAGILADARARAARGRLHGPAAKRVECKPLTGADASAARVPYDCIAVTSDLPSGESGPGGVIGHPFRAVAVFSTGRLTWCKVSGRPGEGSLHRRDLIVRIPRACSR